MFSPARWITASNWFALDRSIDAEFGSHSMSLNLLGFLVRRRTLCPFFSRVGTKCWPMSPVAPLISMFLAFKISLLDNISGGIF